MLPAGREFLVNFFSVLILKPPNSWHSSQSFSACPVLKNVIFDTFHTSIRASHCSMSPSTKCSAAQRFLDVSFAQKESSVKSCFWTFYICLHWSLFSFNPVAIFQEDKQKKYQDLRDLNTYCWFSLTSHCQWSKWWASVIKTGQESTLLVSLLLSIHLACLPVPFLFVWNLCRLM